MLLNLLFASKTALCAYCIIIIIVIIAIIPTRAFKAQTSAASVLTLMSSIRTSAINRSGKEGG